MESEEYALAFSNLGNELDVTSSMKAVLKKFVCHLYGAENQSDVNLVRYLLFKGGKFDEELLPPNEDSLEQHVKRAKFQCFIWRRAMNSMMDAPSFSGHGWEINNIGHVHITWMIDFPKSAVRGSWKRHTFVTRKRTKFTDAFLLRSRQ